MEKCEELKFLGHSNNIGVFKVDNKVDGKQYSYKNAENFNHELKQSNRICGKF